MKHFGAYLSRVSVNSVFSCVLIPVVKVLRVKDGWAISSKSRKSLCKFLCPFSLLAFLERDWYRRVHKNEEREKEGRERERERWISFRWERVYRTRLHSLRRASSVGLIWRSVATQGVPWCAHYKLREVLAHFRCCTGSQRYDRLRLIASEFS